MGLEPMEHPLDLFAAAHLVAHQIRYSNLPVENKTMWYERIQSALEGLLEGVQFEVREDGSYWFDSKPKAKRKQEEKAGHHLTKLRNVGWVCDCPGGQFGTVCWARAARAMIEEIDKPTFERTFPEDSIYESEELFEGDDNDGTSNAG